jgi:hypothetical protein
MPVSHGGEIEIFLQRLHARKSVVAGLFSLLGLDDTGRIRDVLPLCRARLGTSFAPLFPAYMRTKAVL